MRTVDRHRSVYDRYFGHDQVMIIEPQSGWRLLDWKELWAYRELLYVLTMRDIKVRYKQTVLGFAWAIIQPFMMMVVFSVFFGRLANMPSDGFPYPIFVYAALLPWTFFANSITSSANSLVGSANLVSKVYFPRLIIPLSSVGSGLVDFAIAGGILLLLMVYYGVGWTANLFIVPILVIAAAFTALGVGTFLAALNVAYRDFRYVVPFLVQFWMFATPAIYMQLGEQTPAGVKAILTLNPLNGLVAAFRATTLGRPLPWGELAISFACAV